MAFSLTLFSQAYAYAASHPEQLRTAASEHLRLVVIPLGVSLGLGLPLGWLSSRSPLAATLFLNSFNALRVVPSLAILFVLIPYTGLSFLSAAIALILLALPPILLNTHIALRTIDPAILEAARGMGMTSSQTLWQVELPLAVPVLLAGIKTATVEVISSATLAAFIGAGGLGSFITLGFAVYDNAILLVGAIPVALLALLAELSLGWLQKRLETRPT
uniref:Binding-protein-dependent transport systems inner membrane component n=1 Tax=Cyanothece sp. (strain PCC 7425 / ATCC 29141) TaxID=395961 RepID=B8HQR2_CYAP4